ncbi:cytochrome P450 [Aspergillus venezuelensis]
MIAPTILAVCCGLLVFALIRLRWLRFKQYAHLPGPANSLLWGHIGLIMKLIRQDTSKHFLVLDLRPAFFPITVVYSHELAEQISRATPQFKYSLPKAPLQDMIGHVIGRDSFLVNNGEPWRETRKMFNAAFAPNRLMTFIPSILEKIDTFLGVLDGHARSGDVFELGERCTLLTFDVIGQVILNIDLKTQGEKSEQHRVLLNPRKYQQRMQITRTIEASLASIIQEKFEKLHGDKAAISDRSVLSLALEGIETLTPQAIQTSIDSIRTFLFCWIRYNLSRTPRALTALRDELDQVLGPNADPKATADAIICNEAKLNQLVYVTAVIKETLRLHPPAGTSRFAEPGNNFHLQTPRGLLGVDGAILFLNHFSIQRDRSVYGESAEAWILERWLQGGDEGDSLAAGAWRPFERGPRGCIGQELAMLEARLVLAMAVRRYKFVIVGLGAIADGDGIIDKHGQHVSAEPLYDVNVQHVGQTVDGTRMRLDRRLLV